MVLRAYLFVDEIPINLFETRPVVVAVADESDIRFAFQIELSSAAKIEIGSGKHREEHYVDDAFAAIVVSVPNRFISASAERRRDLC